MSQDYKKIEVLKQVYGNCQKSSHLQHLLTEMLVNHLATELEPQLVDVNL